MKKCSTKKKESNPERVEFIIQKGHNTAIINTEKGNCILAHADQIKPQGEYEEQNEEEISMIPSVNDYAWSGGSEWVWKVGWRSNDARRQSWLQLSAGKI